MIVDVLTKDRSYHHYTDTNESKLLIDIEDGKLSIRRRYKNETDYLTFYPYGTWISVHVGEFE